MPDFPDSCSFIGTATSRMSNFPSTSSHRPVAGEFFARSFCLELSLDTHVILSLLKASSSIQVCTYFMVKAVIARVTTPWSNCLLIEVIGAIKTIEE